MNTGKSKYSSEEIIEILSKSKYRFEIAREEDDFKYQASVYVFLNGKWKQIYRSDECGEVVGAYDEWGEVANSEYSEIVSLFSDMEIWYAKETEGSLILIDSFSDG